MNEFDKQIGKGYDPLMDDLRLNGPELKWIGAAIGAVTGIVGGIASGNAAKAQEDAMNEAMERQYEYDVDVWKYNWNESNRDYDHVMEGVQIQRDNDAANRDFAHKMSIRDYQQKRTMQLHEYMGETRQYQQSEKNYRDQLGFNEMAAAVAYEDEVRKYDEIKIGQAFQRQDLMVQGLQESGDAQLLQSGRSAGKSMQSAIAALGRNNAILDESLRSAHKQHQVNVQKINVDKYGADLSAHAQRMLAPLMPPPIMKPLSQPIAQRQDPRKPKKPPKPVKGAKATGAGWSATASLLGGIGNAVSGLAGISSSDMF